MSVDLFLSFINKYKIPKHGLVFFETDGINLLEKYIPMQFNNILYIYNEYNKNITTAIENNHKYSVLFINAATYNYKYFHGLLKYMYAVYFNSGSANNLNIESFQLVENNFYVNKKYIEYKLHDSKDQPNVTDYKDIYDIRFNEEEYLLKYPDVARAVKNGQFESGYQHYNVFGKKEGRTINKIKNDNTFGQLL